MINPEEIFQRYQRLQKYVGWNDDDVERVRSTASILEPYFPAVVADFYAEIEQHPEAAKVVTGGAAQVERLKGTLTNWLQELLAGQYDADYVSRRWRVGYRHVDIGLDQVYTNVALSRLRSGLTLALQNDWPADPGGLAACIRSLNKLLDLDLAIIEDAYQTEYTNRLQSAERLIAIGQVAGGIAHELRNPLNVIKTSAYYLLNARKLTSEKTVEHLQRIEKQVELSDNVITALSRFAKLPLPTLQPFSVEACLRSAVEETALPAAIELELDCPDSLPHALADADQMQIVLGNLIRNAGDAMPDGGRLTLSAHNGTTNIEIAVKDTGHGIPEDQLSRVMEPLFSTKARGMGLGLSMARAIVEKNNGHLSVESEANRGTTFTIQIPAAVA